MLDDQQIAQIFLDHQVIDPPALEQGRALARRDGQPLYQILISQGLVNEERAILAVSKQLNIPCVSLREFEPDPKMLELIPVQTAQTFSLMPLGMTEDDGEEKLYVAMSNPMNLEAIDEVSRQSGFSIVPLLAGPVDMVESIARAYNSQHQSMEDMGLDDELVVEDLIPTSGLDSSIDVQDLIDDTTSSATATPSAPKKPSRPSLPPLAQRTVEKPKTVPRPLFSGGMGIDFGRIDLGANREGATQDDPHNQQTLRAGTKIPENIAANSAATASTPAKKPAFTLPPITRPTAAPPKPLAKPTPPAKAAPPPPAAAASPAAAAPAAADPLGDWGDFNLSDDELSPPDDAPSEPLSRQPPSATSRSESSSIRYVPSTSPGPQSDSLIDNIPTPDLLRATIRLLIYKGLLSEDELREEVRTPGSRSTDKPRR